MAKRKPSDAIKVFSARCMDDALAADPKLWMQWHLERFQKEEVGKEVLKLLYDKEKAIVLLRHICGLGLIADGFGHKEGLHACGDAMMVLSRAFNAIHSEQPKETKN